MELLFGSAYRRSAPSTVIQYGGGEYSDPPPPEILQTNLQVGVYNELRNVIS